MPDPGEAVGRVGDQIGECGREETAARDVREVARGRCRERTRYPLIEQIVEQRFQRDPVFGGRLAHSTAQCFGPDVAADRTFRQAG